MRLMTRMALAATGASLVSTFGISVAASEAPQGADSQKYLAEPMPPGVQVVTTERDGYVFADIKGLTFYTAPRSGQGASLASGDLPGKSKCNDVRITESFGRQNPWPAGLTVPNAENRPTCVQVWPPLYADADAKPTGAWNVITRDDGKRQWAYRGQAVYTSWLDRRPGDVLGASRAGPGGGSGGRNAIGPVPNIPPEFTTVPTVRGQMLRSADQAIVYAAAQDGVNRSTCSGDCLKTWEPILASALAVSRGEFSVFEREPGIKQWAFQGRPLYARAQRRTAHDVSDDGGELSEWREVFVQRALSPPNEFTLQDTFAGQVLADRSGKPIYVYSCVEDTEDELACDYPEAAQDYRLAICGNGDPARCQEQFPYVPAAKDAKSESRLWSVMWIDPMTGRRAMAQQPGAISVWAFRDRPVYTFSGDVEAGEIPLAHGFGEFSGRNNGYIVFMINGFS